MLYHVKNPPLQGSDEVGRIGPVNVAKVLLVISSNAWNTA